MADNTIPAKELHHRTRPQYILFRYVSSRFAQLTACSCSSLLRLPYLESYLFVIRISFALQWKIAAALCNFFTCIYLSALGQAACEALYGESLRYICPGRGDAVGRQASFPTVFAA